MSTATTFTNPIRAWVIWLLSALFMFYKYALEVSPSVMTNTLMGAFEIGGTELGNLTACYFYAYLFLQIPAGLLIDKIGPRKVTTIAIALCAVGCVIFAKSNTLFFAGVGRFLTGAGAAFAAVNCLKLILNWFPSRRFAFMTGLMMTVAMLGAAGGQAPLSSFIQSVGNWRHAMETIGLIGLILAVIFWVVVRDKPESHERERHIVAPRLSIYNSLKQILTNPQSWWLSIYSGLAFAPVMIFGGLWGVAFISEAFLIPHYTAAQSVSLIFIGFAVGAPLFGWLSDLLKRRWVVMFWGTIFALISITIIIYNSSLSYIVLASLLFFFGFAISSFLLCFTMMREINLPGLVATAIGFMNAFDALCGAISDPLTGWFLDLKWDGRIVDGARVFSVVNYKIAFITIPAYLLLSLFILWKIKETKCKPSAPSSLP